MAKFRLPNDPCRVLGGHATPKKQTMPVPLYNQIPESKTLSRLNKLSGTSRSMKYHTRKLKEFKDQDIKNRVYATVEFVGQKVKSYTQSKKSSK
jgi:hypothetical protein